MPMSKKTKVTAVAASVLLAPFAAKTVYHVAKATVYLSRCFVAGAKIGWKYGNNPMTHDLTRIHALNLYDEMYEK